MSLTTAMAEKGGAESILSTRREANAPVHEHVGVVERGLGFRQVA